LLTEIIGTRKPIAFLSYVHSDDEHDNGGLTQFCKPLSAEVKVQTGEEFHIFQDRTDIKLGEIRKDYFPLTLEQAGAFIHEKSSSLIII
jgi:hypothetical protein